MTAAAPAPPPLDDGLEQLMRRMRLPHMRRIAPEVIATAKAQRWDPAEVLRALLAEEVAGRGRSSLATRRARAAFPTGKTFDARDERLSSVPPPTQAALPTLEWIARRENLFAGRNRISAARTARSAQSSRAADWLGAARRPRAAAPAARRPWRPMTGRARPASRKSGRR